MSFSNFFTEKKKKARAFNKEPDEIQALKTKDPKDKSKKGNVDKFLGKRAHKKSNFSAKKRSRTSNTDKAIGRRKRKSNKTKNARHILSSKHGIKRSIQKNQNKEYVLDHLQIAEIMKKFGYDWEQEDGAWSNKEERTAPKPKKKRKRKSVKNTDGRKKISDFGNKQNTAFIPKKPEDNNEPLTITRNDKEITVPEDELTNFTTIGAGGIEYDITEEDLMEYLARLILGLVHGGKSAMHFEEVDETNEESDVEEGSTATIITVEPIISTEKVLDKIEDLGYEYFPQLDEWRLDDQFPFAEEAEGENKESILGRTYLSALGHFEVFDFDENDQPISISKKRVIELMSEYGFQWNPETSTWNKEQLEPDEVF